MLNIFYVIEYVRIFRRRTGVMFKCPAVLYVDPQNLMKNRRNLPSGNGVGSEAKTIQATRYKYPCNLYCKPVNQSENTTKVHSSESLDEEPDPQVLPALVPTGKCSRNKV